MSSSQSPGGQNTYAPLPFSYLTGGNAPERGPTGLAKRSVSQDDLDRVGQDQAPYSIYSGRAPQGDAHTRVRKDSMDVVDPRLDITDPYLLSTGALSRQKGASVGDLRDSYSEDPRYRDSVPSEAEAGNVFFRSPEGSDSSGKSPKAPEPSARPQEPVNSLTRPGYTNPNLDTMTRDEEGQGKKLPRFKVADNGGYQYYTGSNNANATPLAEPPKSNSNPPKQEENPIWDKYYATGGLAPGYEGYQPTTPTPIPTTPGVRPTTKEDDFNTLLRNSNDSDGYGSGGRCCRSKRAAVITAVLLTALICLGAGFAAGWFIYQVVNPESGATTTVIPPALTTALPGGVSDALAATTTTPAVEITTAAPGILPTSSS